MGTDPFSGFSGGFNDLLGGLETLFGGTKKSFIKGNATSESTSNISGENRDRLDISDEAIDKIVSDILSGPDGLASIFGGEQTAGIFNSSVAAEAAGNLTSKITGEIAKLRAERIQTENKTQTESSVQTKDVEQTDKKRGLIDQIFG